MRPSYANTDIRTNRLTRVTQDQVERCIQDEQVGAASPIVLPIGDVGKGNRSTVHVGIELEAHHSTERSWEESHF